MDALTDRAGPADIARAAVEVGARAVAFTYNDPIVFAEYAIDTAWACRDAGVRSVAVTAGYISPAARGEFFGAMDAANIDLKSFSEEFYRKVTGGRLADVLDTLEWVGGTGTCWLEVTTLVIPGLNDSTAELSALAGWLRERVGPDVPLHLSAFHPANRMRDVPRTPLATLLRAREIARGEGLRHVYLGNVHTDDGGATVCGTCGNVVVDRRGYTVVRYALTEDGRCAACGAPVPGRWPPEGPASFGPRRLPLRLTP
jgi:pyruvate formate lyase activating enzyme